jgi:hypothetical protein
MTMDCFRLAAERSPSFCAWQLAADKTIEEYIHHPSKMNLHAKKVDGEEEEERARHGAPKAG